jgi:hypothetical protein
MRAAVRTVVRRRRSLRAAFTSAKALQHPETISMLMLEAMAHSAEPAANNATAAMYRRVVPNRSAARPVTGVTVTNARVYPVTVHATVE